MTLTWNEAKWQACESIAHELVAAVREGTSSAQRAILDEAERAHILDGVALHLALAVCADEESAR